MSKAKRRNSGAPRPLPSGNWQARIWDESIGKHVSLGTFPTKQAANDATEDANAARRRGDWVNPHNGKVLFSEYSDQWLGSRPRLRPNTRVLYEGQLRLHINPTFGHKQIANISPASVRSWYAALAEKNNVGDVTVAKVYRLLRTILNTAIEDRLILRNPCVIKQGGKEQSPERPLPTVEEAIALANEMPFHLRPVVLVAAFTALRLGENLGLKRRHVDLAKNQIAVRGQLQEIKGVPQWLDYTKRSRAGYRTVVVPQHVMDAIRLLLESNPVEGMDSWIFRAHCQPENNPVTRQQLRYWWNKARIKLNLEHLHFHDLRHTGQSVAVGVPGVSHADVMKRMGHSTIDASQRYMHARGTADAAIADAIQTQIEQAISGARATVTELPEAGQG